MFVKENESKRKMARNIKLKIICEENRKRLLEIIYNAKAGHTGGDLSSLNMMTFLYESILNITASSLNDKNRNRFILSKGHCVEALFTVLESKGIIPKEMVDTLGKFKSPLAGHPTVNVPGIEASSGALGHGLPIGTGIAIAAKMDNLDYKTYVLMGDGEQGEGSIYEAAMAANQYKLDNLVAIIDRNGLQISGTTEEVMAIENINRKWSAFGWDVMEVDGNDTDAIEEVFNRIDYGNKKPHLIISHTTKGYGVDFMENVAKWHHGLTTEDEYAMAIGEIEQRIIKLKNEQ